MAGSSCRYWAPTATLPTSESTATCCGWATWRCPSPPAAGTAPAPLCTTASTIGWSDGGTGCAATAVSSRSPRWPACARKTALCSTPATQRSLAGSPKDSSTACASTTSTDYPIPADTWPSCANCSARTPGSWSKKSWRSTRR